MTDPRGRHITLQKSSEPRDPESMHHGGSFKKYMEFKNQKLREQFREEAVEGDEALKPKLFSGVSIHVNGFTIPTHQVDLLHTFGQDGYCASLLCFGLSHDVLLLAVKRIAHLI